MVSKLRKSVYPEMKKFRTKEYNDILLKYPSITKQEAFDILERKYYCIVCNNVAKFISLKLGYSKYCSVECYELDNNFKSFDNIVDDVKNGRNLSAKDFVTIRKLFNKTPRDLYIAIFGETKCKHCSKSTTFINFQKGFSDYCSVSCSNYYKDFSRTESKNKEIQEKRKKTCIERYGVDNNLKLLDNSGINNIMHKNNKTQKSLKAKYKKTVAMSKLYKSHSNHPFPHIRHRENLNERFIKDNFVRSGKFDVLSASNYFNCSISYFNKFELPRTINKGEEWIQSIVHGKTNDRTLISPLEIDVLNYDKKFGVEFNGLAFHSAGISTSAVFNKPNYICKHLEKTKLVENKGFQLFHIFEDEYLNPIKRKIWESILKHQMGNVEVVLYGRNCKVRKISYRETAKFLDKNHLQGTCYSKINYGLYHNNELVSVMTFGKSRFNKCYQYELIRFCIKVDYHVHGAFSKLLRHFEREYKPTSIISYANRRWSMGKVYELNGFEFLYNTKPNYFYFKPNECKLLSRHHFQKHKLKNKLQKFEPNLSESQNMFNNGYRKIYDCGNKVYVKEYKNKGAK